MKDFRHRDSSLRGVISKISFFAITAFCLLMMSSLAWGQVIVGFDTSTQPGGVNNFGASPLAPATTATNVTATGLTRGSGVLTTGTGAARGFGGTGFNNATSAAAIAANTFFTFTVKANTGFALSLSSINPFDYRRSNTGATVALVQYSTDGTTFTDITTVNLTSSLAAGASAGPIDLSGIAALQNLPATTTVTFRIVPYGASGAGGTFYIFDVGISTANDLAVNGTTAPAGTTAAMVSVGGRVSGLKNRAISGATVIMTDGNGQKYSALTDESGNYRFEAEVGQVLLFEVRAKRYFFTQPLQVVSLTDELMTVNFNGYSARIF